MTPDNLANNIRRSLPEVNKLFGTIELFASNEILARMLARIFNDGLAKDGNKIGTYKSGSYKRKREKAGRQVDYKDEQFSGALFEAMNVGKYKGKPAVGITTETSANISRYQEKQVGRVIFSPSQSELEEVKAAMRNQLVSGMNKIFKSWSR